MGARRENEHVEKNVKSKGRGSWSKKESEIKGELENRRGSKTEENKIEVRGKTKSLLFYIIL